MPAVRRTAASCTSATALLLLLTGCASTGSMSCADYRSQDVFEQSETLAALLMEHDLDPTHLGNIAGVTEAVGALCRSDESAVLDDAADWESDTW